jgi:hypothetical protein
MRGEHAMPNSVDRRSSSGSFRLIVALVATGAMCVQNAGSALAFGWALIHGAGPAAVAAFWPLAIGLGLLWGAFWYLNRHDHRHASALFIGLAVAMLIGYEMVLPATPLTSWRAERAMRAAVVHNVHDEPLLSARGNPIGIRVTYEVIFPDAVVANVHLGVTRVHGEVLPYMQAKQFGRQWKTIDPEPSARGIYSLFEKKRIYRFTVASMPGFLYYDRKKQQPCLDLFPGSGISEPEIVAALKQVERDTYHVGISITSDDVPIAVHQGSYVTSGEYDLQAMYQTIVTEGHQQCNIPDYERWRRE